ncbi:MAG: 6-pyruvoyl tetrahydropterin synthase family protein [Candidatus Methylomirabilia bacterium]
MQLTTEFGFDAAHRILGHPGKCAYLHGHTYRLEVTVSTDQLNRLGMVVDIDDLRAVVKKAVLEPWDHATLLWSEDPLAPAIEAVQSEAPEKVVRLPGNPTAEVLTREAWEAIGRGLPAGLRLERLVISESLTCRSELTRAR